MKNRADDIGSITANMNFGPDGSVRHHVMHRFLDALTHFSEKEKSPGLRLLSRVRICEFYMERVGEASARDGLRSLTREDCWTHLNRYDRKAKLPEKEAALKKALYDVSRCVNDPLVRLRTNGQLILGGAGDLDGPVVEVKGKSQVFDGEFDGAVIRLKLPPRVRVRRGAPVRVEIEAKNVSEDPTAPHVISPRALSRLIGVTSLGGDAAVDSEDWEA